MPDPDRLLRTFAKAVQATRATPGRRGRLIHLEGASEVLTAGDLHGNLENFRRILEIAKLAENPGRHLILQELIHGPLRYVSGGDKSHQALDVFAALKSQFPERVHMLLGNHELAQWTGQVVGKGDEEYNQIFRQGVEDGYGARAEAIYTAYLELFNALPVAIRTPNRVFLSHSLPSGKRLATFNASLLEQEDIDPAEFQLGGSVHALVWGRDTRPETVADFLARVDADLLISGHIPCDNGFEAPNDRQLILDCMKEPAAYCLFPTDRPLTHNELLECVGIL
jgi:hypothetical protein